ncbi:MAG TPA: hypothetical protein ACN46Q_08845, partial [Prochlorococcus sp.]
MAAIYEPCQQRDGIVRLLILAACEASRHPWQPFHQRPRPHGRIIWLMRALAPPPRLHADHFRHR